MAIGPRSMTIRWNNEKLVFKVEGSQLAIYSGGELIFILSKSRARKLRYWMDWFLE